MGGGGGAGYAARYSLFVLFSRFSRPRAGLAHRIKQFFRVDNKYAQCEKQNTVDPMLFPSGNPFKCHKEVLYLQPLIPPKRFDIFSPLTGGCSEGLGAF